MNASRSERPIRYRPCLGQGPGDLSTVQASRPFLIAFRIVFCVMPLHAAAPGDSEHFRIRDRERRTNRRSSGRKLDQLVEVTALRRRLAALPFLDCCRETPDWAPKRACVIPSFARRSTTSTIVLASSPSHPRSLAASPSCGARKPFSHRDTQARETPSLVASCEREQISVRQTRSMARSRKPLDFAPCLTCYHPVPRW